MRTHVEFRTSKFPPYEGEDQQVSPGLYGKRLAEYLRAELRKRGVQTGEIYAEDWGWAVPLQGHPFPMWLGCGHYHEYDDGFLCFIEPGKPYVRRWFKKGERRAAIERVAAALDEILRNDPEIGSVQWWTDQARGA